MLALLAFGTVWFWIVSLLSFCIIVWCVEEKENSIGAAITFALYVLVVVYLGNYHSAINFLQKINVLNALLIMLGYFASGAIWSVIKWTLWLFKQRSEILIEIEGKEDSFYTIPTARNEKSRILRWMIYWPFSMIWTIINDPIRRGMEFIYERIHKLYQQISVRIFKDLIDLKMKIEAEQKVKREKEQAALEERLATAREERLATETETKQVEKQLGWKRPNKEKK